jgi:hypothetical protein
MPWKLENEMQMNSRLMHLSQQFFIHLSLKAAESDDDINNTIAGDVDDKVDSKSVEERVACYNAGVPSS